MTCNLVLSKTFCFYHIFPRVGTPNHAEKSPCHTLYGVQVLEFLLFIPQIQQDRLQRLLLGTGFHILHRSASEAASCRYA